MSLLYWLTARVPMVVLARRNLSRATARSALAVVAIVIGVVAIGAIGTGGEAFKQDQLEAFEGFGGTATVDPIPGSERSDRSATTFSQQEIDRMRQATDGATVLPVAEPPGSFVRSPTGEPILTAQVQGIGNPGDFYDARAGEIPDNWRRSVVVGSRIANENDIEPGDRVTVFAGEEVNGTFTVAAVLEPQGFADPLDADRTVFVPLSQFEEPEYDRAIVKVDPRTGSVETASEEIRSEFNSRERTVSVNPVQSQRESFEQLFGTLNQFLIGVGAISLLVAAVTIANTMLMSAIEREGEIGVMRAVGYPRGAVIRLLVAESTILGAVGAAIGAPLALLFGMALNEFLVGNPLAFTATGLQYVGVGVAFGIVTALVAGIYPAWRASRKRPVEAID